MLVVRRLPAGRPSGGYNAQEAAEAWRQGKAVMQLQQLLPDARTLVALPVHERAGALLEVLLAEYPNRAGRPDKNENISLTNTCSSEAQGYRDGNHIEIDRAIAEAFQHLINTGMLIPNPNSHPYGWFVFSAVARSMKSGEDFRRYAHGALFPVGKIHPRIEALTLPEFIKGDYDTAIFKAFKAVEEEVRQRGGFGNEVIGVPLMRQALHPENGPLTDKTEQAGEREALMHLFAGAIGRFKNPVSHRFTGLDDPVVAIEVIQFASLMLRLIEKRLASS